MVFQCGYVEVNLQTAEQISGDRQKFLDFSQLKVKKIGVSRIFFRDQYDNLNRKTEALLDRLGFIFRWITH
jgi:hypothetical protein